MDLKQVEFFLRVAEYGSINRAAFDLEMTQPALSRKIAALEHELGTPLLTKSARGIRLTEAGQFLANQAPALVRQGELVRQEIGRAAKTQVSIGLPFSFNRLVTAPFAAFQIRENKGIHLRVYEAFINHLDEWMQNGLIDIGIMNEEMGGLTSQSHSVLLHEQLVLVGPKSAPMEADQPVSAAFLNDCPLILPGRPNPFRKKIESFLAANGQRFRKVADAETLPLCFSLVKEGLGYTVMPYCAIYDQQDIDGLKIAPIEGLQVTWSLFVNQARRHQDGVRNTAMQLKKMVTDLVRSGQWRYATLDR